MTDENMNSPLTGDVAGKIVAKHVLAALAELEPLYGGKVHMLAITLFMDEELRIQGCIPVTSFGASKEMALAALEAGFTVLIEGTYVEQPTVN